MNRRRRRGLAVLIGLLVMACAAAVVLLTRQSVRGPQSVGNGVTHEIVSVGGAEFRVVRIDPRVAQIRAMCKRPDGSNLATFANVARALAASGQTLVFATNGGIFGPARTPLGLLVQDGRELVPINHDDGDGNFFMKPNGVFWIGANDKAVVASAASYRPEIPIVAVQSGPMLVIDGAIHSQFSATSANRNIRSGVGVDRGGNVVFVLSCTPVTFHEFATLYRDRLACPDALYLDGGISRFFVAGVDGDADNASNFSAMLVVSQP